MLEDRDNWVDTATPEAIDALYKSVTNLPEGMRAYFLLDAVFAPGLAQWLAQRCEGENFCSLYDSRYAGDGIETIAPYLVCLPEPVEQRDALYAELVALSNGKPLLNCLLSDLSLSQSAGHLQEQLEAVDAEGNAFLLRFADTRTLEHLMAVLHPPQKRRMLAGIWRWIYADRQGRFRIVEADASKKAGHVANVYPGVNATELDTLLPQTADDAPYVIDVEQDRQLDRLALPDAILRFAQLRAHMLGALIVPPSVAHGVIEKVVQRLVRHGVFR